jgi:23S rRNA (uracil1939-C5)-methyltransferase
VIFVEGVAPGDVVDLQITRKKKSFLEATPIKFHKLSDTRVEPFCKHYGTCGGCKWQHISYENQLLFKQQQVQDNLERIAKVELPEILPIFAAKKTEYYRNKLEYTFSNRRWLTKEEIQNSGDDLERNGAGFHIPKRFDKIVDIEHCYLQPDPSNQIRLDVRQYALDNGVTFFDLLDQVGLLRNLIIRTTSTGQVMVILQVAEDQPEQIKAILDYVLERNPSITSLNYIINLKRNDSYGDQEVVCHAGIPYIEEQMPIADGDEMLTFRIGPKSFYQTNADQAHELYKITRDLAGLTGEEVVYDLYTGTGTIANFVAHQAKKVIGLEYVEAAIEDAKINSKINNINNTDFFAGDMKDVLNEEFITKHGHPDVIITDPPRAGMHDDVIKALLFASPQKIVYVSCNPATQARDLALLDEQYAVKTVQPVDMFPHTHHVENVVLLEKR